MQRPRIYTPATLRTGTIHKLPEAAVTHIVRVLRLAAGDPIILFDGSGIDYEAVLQVVARTGVTANIGAGHSVDRESPLKISLLQGVSRGARMDVVMQKATELGVHSIQPVLAQRSVVRLDAERAIARQAHWQRIVVGACEQCGRSIVPEVRLPLSLVDAIADLASGCARLSLDPEGDSGMLALLEGSQAVALAIGPEGGFAEVEIQTLIANGFKGLRLGPRILRTETAPLAALAALQFAAGDLGNS